MLVAVALLIAPGAFHQIVERGNDSPRVIDSSHIATLALLPSPWASADVHLFAAVVLGGAAARPAGLAAIAFALVFWYGLEWMVRSSHATPARTTEDRHAQSAPSSVPADRAAAQWLLEHAPSDRLGVEPGGDVGRSEPNLLLRFVVRPEPGDAWAHRGCAQTIGRGDQSPRRSMIDAFAIPPPSQIAVSA